MSQAANGVPASIEQSLPLSFARRGTHLVTAIKEKTRPNILRD
jgi:hypothetical protein